MDKTAFLRLGDLGDPRERHKLVEIRFDNHLLRANINTHLIRCKVNIPSGHKSNSEFMKRLSIRIFLFLIPFFRLLLPFNDLIRAVALPGILSYNYSLVLLVDETLIMSPWREAKRNCFWPNKATM